MQRDLVCRHLQGMREAEAELQGNKGAPAVPKLECSSPHVDCEIDGEIDGEGVYMPELRPTVIEAQAAMKAGYGAAFESARGKQSAAAGFDRITALAEISGKVQQPGGALLDLVGLYKGALGAVGELWAYGQRAIAASGEAGVAASWGIKKVCAPSPAVRCP